MTHPTPDHRAEAADLLAAWMLADDDTTNQPVVPAMRVAVDHIIEAAVEAVEARKTERDATHTANVQEANVPTWSEDNRRLKRELLESRHTVDDLQGTIKTMCARITFLEKGDPVRVVDGVPYYEVKDTVHHTYPLECNICGKQWNGKTLTEVCPNKSNHGIHEVKEKEEVYGVYSYTCADCGVEYTTSTKGALHWCKAEVKPDPAVSAPTDPDDPIHPGHIIFPGHPQYIGDAAAALEKDKEK